MTDMRYNIQNLTVDWIDLCKRATLSPIQSEAGRLMPDTRRLNDAQRRLQEVVHPRPKLDRQARVERITLHAPGEEGTEQVTLGNDAASAPMPPLRQRFLRHGTTDAHLRQSCRPCREFLNCTASTYSLAAQKRDEHPRGAEANRLAVHLLECLVGEFLLSLIHI